MPGSFLGALAVGREKALERQARDAQQQQLQNFSALKFGQDAQLAQSQIGENNARADALRNPKPTVNKWAVEPREDGTYLVDQTTGESKKINVPGVKREPAPEQPDRTLVPVQQPDGSVVYTPRPDAAGKQVPKSASATGGASAEKNKALLDLMEQGYPMMEQPSGKIRPNRIALAIEHPSVGNALLSQDEQNYMVGFRNFLAGVLHVESGARLSKDQLMFGFQRFGPAFGDKDETKATKLQTAKATLLARRAEFGGDASSTGGPPGDINLAAPVKTKGATPLVSDDDFNAILNKYKK